MAKYCHELIKQTAIGIAEAFYEEKARDNRFHKIWPSGRRFVRAKWPDFIPTATSTLVDMLADPKNSEHVKETIFLALVKNRSLPQDTVQHMPVAGNA